MKGTRTIRLTAKEAIDLLLIAGMEKAGPGKLPQDARPLYSVVYEEGQDMYICLESEAWVDHLDARLTTSRDHRGVEMRLIECGAQAPFFANLRLRAYTRRLSSRGYVVSSPEMIALGVERRALSKGHNFALWEASLGQVTFY